MKKVIIPVLLIMIAYTANHSDAQNPFATSNVWGNTANFIKPTPLAPYREADIYQIRIKEDWFIDKQKSYLEVRILGICPILLVKDDNDNVKGNLPMFWINFEQARLLFANVQTFNPFNDAMRLTYDDLFMKRIFSSYIIKKSNVYNRSIAEYKTGIDALLESEQIKDDIFNTELDLWEY